MKRSCVENRGWLRKEVGGFVKPKVNCQMLKGFDDYTRLCSLVYFFTVAKVCFGCKGDWFRSRIFDFY